MIRGCNTIFSSYSFDQGIFSNFNKISTKKACPNNNDAIIENIVFSSNKYFISLTSSPKYLDIRSPQGAVLLQLIDKPPQ
mgnify:CR=1 FL=1